MSAVENTERAGGGSSEGAVAPLKRPNSSSSSSSSTLLAAAADRAGHGNTMGGGVATQQTFATRVETMRTTLSRPAAATATGPYLLATASAPPLTFPAGGAASSSPPQLPHTATGGGNAAKPAAAFSSTPNSARFGEIYADGKEHSVVLLLRNNSDTDLRWRVSDRALLGPHSSTGNSLRVRHDGGPLQA